MGLNALSGIGGFQTTRMIGSDVELYVALMPCRALEAFRQELRHQIRELQEES